MLFAVCVVVELTHNLIELVHLERVVTITLNPSICRLSSLSKEFLELCLDFGNLSFIGWVMEH